MQLRHLEIFCTVYDLGSMSRAAEKMNMTQPGVSRIIAELEEEFRTSLFIRKNRSLIATYQADKCYEISMRILKELKQLSYAMNKENPKTELRIGCSTGISYHIMPDVINQFHKRYPECKTFVHEGTPMEIQKGVKDGRYGIGFVQEFIVDKEIIHRLFCHDKVLPVAAPDYVTQASEPISFRELANENLIMTLPLTGIRNIIEQYASTLNITLNPIWSCKTGSTACSLAEQGFGIALLSDKTVQASIEKRRLRVVKVREFDLRRGFYQIWKDSAILSEEEEYILQLSMEAGIKKDISSIEANI